MLTFRSLRTKLAVIYAGLFSLVLLSVGAAALFTVQNSATGMVRGEMSATAAVFNRIWDMHAEQMGDAADILSRDFGFRAAVATRDDPTIDSALENLRQRFGFDLAFVMTENGSIVGVEPSGLEMRDGALFEILSSRDSAGGVLLIAGAPHHAVARPVRAPTRVGWVVFAYRLSETGLSDLTELSSIPLDARLYWRESDGDWTAQDPDAPGLTHYTGGEIDIAQFDRGVRYTPGKAALASILPIDAFIDGLPVALVLEYPVALAMAPFRGMFVSIAAAGLAGLLVLIVGTWILARGLTNPIQALERAARRLADGEAMRVDLAGRDEIARLASSFNTMGETIAAREQRIRELALRDSETGLPNLAALEGEVEMRLLTHPADQVYALTIGIDRFAEIRAAIGYRLASRILARIEERLCRVCPEAFIGRTASDTLGVVLTATDFRMALGGAAELCANANQAVAIEDERVDVHAAVGLVSVDKAADTGLSVIECSAVALDQARQADVPVTVFDSERYGDPTVKLSLMSRMMDGLGNGHLFLAYQPKYDFRTQQTTAVEALLRWQDPERGFIGPDDFIPLAEETGHILPLTEWVLDRAIADQVRMRAAGHDLQVAINISGRLVSDERFIRHALDRLSRHSGRICFEITETAVINKPDAALENIHVLRDAGISVSIDDYGAGLSSLSYLRSIPAEELKIDKAFVLELGTVQSDRLLVKSTIDLAHSLGMKVTAEGVEDAESIAILASMGADYAQGYHIGRPMPLAGFLDYMQERGSESDTDRDDARAAG
ncbi:EAL domain-containing protein [uncultured Maricaulis sp.]|uniref:bifunctional diguanylate cyclase/phosphodiesterase n=1 Tax=uncultured Maricaulis sp. TaxID=174710 RepID=UPI002631FF56|nr:EAL domain-containing protein [uncultured Maricaulis sp.]